MIITGLTGTSSGSSEEILEKLSQAVDLLGANVQTLPITKEDPDRDVLMTTGKTTSFGLNSDKEAYYESSWFRFKSYGYGTAVFHGTVSGRHKNSAASLHYSRLAGIKIYDPDSNLMGSYSASTTYQSSYSTSWETLTGFDFSFAVSNLLVDTIYTVTAQVQMHTYYCYSGYHEVETTLDNIYMNYAVKNIMHSGVFEVL